MSRIVIVSRDRRSQTGNIGVLFAGALVLLAIGAGVAIDTGTREKARVALQEATDAAVLAAAVAKREGETAASAAKIGERMFEDRCRGGICGENPSIAINASGPEVSGSGDAFSPAIFLKVIGREGDALTTGAAAGGPSGGGTVGAGAFGGAPVDIHLLLDVSGSMYIPDGQPEIDRFTPLFQPMYRDPGCSFACHGPIRASDRFGVDLRNGMTGFEVAIANGVRLRLDVVKDAAIAAARTITQDRGGQVGFHYFGHDRSPPLRTVNAIGASRDIDAIANEISNIPFGKGLTYIDRALDEMDRYLSSQIDSSRRQVLVIVTNGVKDLTADEAQTPDIDKCAAIKDDGVDIAMIHIAYPDPKKLMGVQEQLDQTLTELPKIESFVRSCASQGLYFSAADGVEIDNAFSDMVDATTDVSEIYLRR